jgi:hypothetical protein
MTVNEDPEVEEAASKTGALGYVLTHFVATDFLCVIDEALAGSTFSPL